MTREEATNQVNSAIDALVATLGRGYSEKVTAHLATVARFHRYSLNNVLLIPVQLPDATHVAGFQAWQKLGRFVRRGESGIVILAPMMYPRNGDHAEQQAAELPEDRAEASVLRAFKVAHVFHVSQAEGEQLLEFAQVTGDPGNWIDRLKAFVADQPVLLEC